MVGERTQQPHKLPGNDGCGASCPELHERHDKCAHPSEDGQSDSNMLYQSHGRHPIPDTVRLGMPTVAVVPSKGDNSGSQTPPRFRQC